MVLVAPLHCVRGDLHLEEEGRYRVADQVVVDIQAAVRAVLGGRRETSRDRPQTEGDGLLQHVRERKPMIGEILWRGKKPPGLHGTDI